LKELTGAVQGMTSAHLVRPLIHGVKELYENGDETLQRDAGYVMTAMAAEPDLTGDYTETFLDSFVAGKMPNLLSAYTVLICQQSYLLLFGIPSPTHSFFPGLKPSFSAIPSHCSPSFLLLKYLLRGFPGLFTVISEHICFLLLVSLFLLFLVVGYVR